MNETARISKRDPLSLFSRVSGLSPADGRSPSGGGLLRRAPAVLEALLSHGPSGTFTDTRTLADECPAKARKPCDEGYFPLVLMLDTRPCEKETGQTECRPVECH